MTPHTDTGQPPAKLMLRYEPRTKLAGMEKTVQSKEMRQAREQERREMKRRYDKVHHTKQCEKVEDVVVQLLDKKVKFTPRFGHQPYKVISRNGNVVVIERDGLSYKCNVSNGKKGRNDFGL